MHSMAREIGYSTGVKLTWCSGASLIRSDPWGSLPMGSSQRHTVAAALAWGMHSRGLVPRHRGLSSGSGTRHATVTAAAVVALAWGNSKAGSQGDRTAAMVIGKASRG